MKHNNWHPIIRSLRANSLWILAIVLIFTWWACLSLKIEVSFASFTLLTFYAGAVLGLLLSLSGQDQRRLIILLFLGGLTLRTIEILIIQTLPQYSALTPDAVRYDLHARALIDHWQGLPVIAKDYGLPGPTGSPGGEWLPTDWLAYGIVFGGNVLYQVYVGFIYLLLGPQQIAVILSHTVLLAALAPAVYSLSTSLFENKNLAILAASLTLIDPSFAAIGAFLWKDSLAAFLAIIALWATVLVIQRREAYYYPMLVLVAALLGLSQMRYHIVLGFWVAAAVVMVLAYGPSRIRRSVAVLDRGRTRRLLAVLVLSLVGSMVVSSPPWLPQGLEGIFSATPLVAVEGRMEEIQATSEEDWAYDETTANWVQSLREDPLRAVAKTVAHTLFAPYPWVPFVHGLYYNFVELFYPGVTMLFVGLPFLFVALWRLPVRRSPELLLIMIWLVLIVSSYIVYQGEFSTRQRVFMMPLLWILVSFGVEQVRAYFNRRRQQDGSAKTAR